jgi:hypothetical protein
MMSSGSLNEANQSRLKDSEATCVPSLTDKVLNATATLEGSKKIAVFTVTYSMNITSRASLNISSNKLLLDIQSSIESMTVKPSIAYSQAKAAAERGMESTNGIRMLTLLDVDAAKEIAISNGQFANTGCAMLLTTRQTVPFAGGRITIEYSPALPMFPNFGAPPAALAAELDQARSWSNIRATIVASTASDYPAGETGNVRVALSPLGDNRYKMEWAVDGVAVSKQGAFGVSPFAEYVAESGAPSLIVYPALDGDTVVKSLTYQ